MMCRRSFRRPGEAVLPALIQSSRLMPPFHARGGEAEDLGLDQQRSSVRARMSAQTAATMIGRPRIEPELSISSVGQAAEPGVGFLLERQRRGRIGDDPRQARDVEHALLEIEAPGAVLLRHQAARSLLARCETTLDRLASCWSR